MKSIPAWMIYAFAGAAGAVTILQGHRLLPVALGQASEAPAVVPSAEAGNADLVALSDRFEAVARKVLPSVVSVEAIKTAAGGKPVEDSGSGVVVAAEFGGGQWVVTNYHVVAQARPEQIHINHSDGRLFKPTKVLADPETDVALLRVESPTPLPAAALGDSDKVRIGQWVLALGSPFGLSQSVTHGIISARGRGQVSLGSTIRIKDFLQTDAAINPGSSGGPLVNLSGEVIGINTAIASRSNSSSGVAFSIPINLVRRVARQLQERGKVSHGYLGVQLSATFDPASAQKLGLERARGAKIDYVFPDTPAAVAGLRPNDVILQLDAIGIRNDNHLIFLISMLPPGQRVKLTVWRDRAMVSADVVIGDWGAARPRAAGEP